MKSSQILHQFLLKWPRALISDRDLVSVLPRQDELRYDMVKHALQKGVLQRLKRGIYLVSPPYRKENYHPFTRISQNILLTP